MRSLRALIITGATVALALPANADEWWLTADRAGSDMPEGERQPSPIVDPMGDASNTFGAGPPLTDIDTVTVTFDPVAEQLFFSLTFHTPIAPLSAGRPESLVGLLEFDIDQSAATGLPPIQNTFSPPFTRLRTGVDVLVFLGDTTPALLDVFDVNLGLVGQVKATFGPMSVSGFIPFAWLRNDDGVVDFTTTIGTVPQPTDALEVVGFSVPEPGTITLLGLATMAVGRRRR